MTEDYFSEVLDQHLLRRPFSVFSIELVGGERLEIDHPTAFSHRGGFCIFLAPGRTPHWFDHNSVLRIVSANANIEN